MEAIAHGVDPFGAGSERDERPFQPPMANTDAMSKPLPGADPGAMGL